MVVAQNAIAKVEFQNNSLSRIAARHELKIQAVVKFGGSEVRSNVPAYLLQQTKANWRP